MDSSYTRFLFVSIVLGFSLETDFEDYVKQINNSKKVVAAIVFDHNFQNSNDPLPLKVRKFYIETL